MWLSRDLGIALAIAMGIHFGSLILFRFPELKTRQLTTLDASWVERVGPSDPSLATHATWSPRPQKPLLTADELLTLSTTPHLPSWTPSLSPATTLSRSPEEDLPSFAHLEQSLFTKTTSQQEHASKLAIHVSGPLASYPYSNDSTTLAQQTLALPACLLRFSVRVDPDTRRVAWFTLVHGEPDALPEHLALADSVLHNMRFTCATCGLVSGEVELSFQPVLVSR
jgi:hypothetical protein